VRLADACSGLCGPAAVPDPENDEDNELKDQHDDPQSQRDDSEVELLGDPRTKVGTGFHMPGCGEPIDGQGWQSGGQRPEGEPVEPLAGEAKAEVHNPEHGHSQDQELRGRGPHAAPCRLGHGEAHRQGVSLPRIVSTSPGLMPPSLLRRGKPAGQPAAADRRGKALLSSGHTGAIPS
jgi:hypothetical protein